jgi:hypothetical protein
MLSARDRQSRRIQHPVGQVVLGGKETSILTTHDNEGGYVDGPQSIYDRCIAVNAQLPSGWVRIGT